MGKSDNEREEDPQFFQQLDPVLQLACRMDEALSNPSEIERLVSEAKFIPSPEAQLSDSDIKAYIFRHLKYATSKEHPRPDITVLARNVHLARSMYAEEMQNYPRFYMPVFELTEIREKPIKAGVLRAETR